MNQIIAKNFFLNFLNFLLKMLFSMNNVLYFYNQSTNAYYQLNYDTFGNWFFDLAKPLMLYQNTTFFANQTPVYPDANAVATYMNPYTNATDNRLVQGTGFMYSVNNGVMTPFYGNMGANGGNFQPLPPVVVAPVEQSMIFIKV